MVGQFRVARCSKVVSTSAAPQPWQSTFPHSTIDKHRCLRKMVKYQTRLTLKIHESCTKISKLWLKGNQQQYRLKCSVCLLNYLVDRLEKIINYINWPGPPCVLKLLKLVTRKRAGRRSFLSVFPVVLRRDANNTSGPARKAICPPGLTRAFLVIPVKFDRTFRGDHFPQVFKLTKGYFHRPFSADNKPEIFKNSHHRKNKWHLKPVF